MHSETDFRSVAFRALFSSVSLFMMDWYLFTMMSVIWLSLS